MAVDADCTRAKPRIARPTGGTLRVSASPR